MVKEMSFKVISSFSSGGHFVKKNSTVCAVLVEGIIGHIHGELF